MKTRHSALALAILSTALVAACDSAVAPEGRPAGAPSLAVAQAPQPIMASGTFAQNAITSLESRSAGPNTILDQTSTGTVSGTLSGSYEDDLTVVIHPNGRFNAHFTIVCQCTVDGKVGTLELVASDTGEMVGPALAAFAGRAVITGGSGELSDLRGVLEIEGTVDLVSGLSTYAYSGTIR